MAEDHINGGDYLHEIEVQVTVLFLTSRYTRTCNFNFYRIYIVVPLTKRQINLRRRQIAALVVRAFLNRYSFSSSSLPFPIERVRENDKTFNGR